MTLGQSAGSKSPLPTAASSLPNSRRFNSLSVISGGSGQLTPAPAAAAMMRPTVVGDILQPAATARCDIPCASTRFRTSRVFFMLVLGLGIVLLLSRVQKGMMPSQERRC
jgi:hypothetical protein